MRGDLKIIIATDLHYLSPDLIEDPSIFKSASNSLALYGGPDMVLDSLIDRIKIEKPDYLLLSGDLTFNGERLSHEGLAEKLRILLNLGIKIIPYPGNHDIEREDSFYYKKDANIPVESISRGEFYPIYHDYYDRLNILARDENSLSSLIELNDYWDMIVIDTNSWEEKGTFKEDSLIWLKSLVPIVKERRKNTVSTSHHTLLKHNPLYERGFKIENSDQILGLLKEMGVDLNLSGHMHNQHIKREGDFKEIVTSSLLTYPFYLGELLLKASGGGYYRAFPLRLGKDYRENYNGKNAFRNSMERQARAYLEDADLYEVKKEELIRSIGDLCIAYFRGDSAYKISDLKKRGIIELWEKYAKEGHFKGFINSIFMEESGTSKFLEF